jgi:mono/diheme cytochrome c family protein
MSTDPYNKSGYRVFIGCMVITTVFFIYISFIHPGVKNVDKNLIKDYNPNAPVSAFDLATVQEPWVPSEDMVKAGQKIYSANCVACHGADYKGVAAMGARNFVEGKWKKGGSSIDLFKTLQNGLPQDPAVPALMASFKHLPKNDRWALVQFVRSVTNNKVADDATALAKFAQSDEAQ